MLTSLKNIAVTLAVTLQTRLELLGNELQLQKLSVARQLGLGLACVFCLGLGVVLAVALAVTIWWEQRVLVLAISLGLCVLGAAWFFVALRRTVLAKEPVFAASLKALRDDLALLKSTAGPNGVDPDANPAHD